MNRNGLSVLRASSFYEVNQKELSIYINGKVIRLRKQQETSLFPHYKAFDDKILVLNFYIRQYFK